MRNWITSKLGSRFEWPIVRPTRRCGAIGLPVARSRRHGFPQGTHEQPPIRCARGGEEFFAKRAYPTKQLISAEAVAPSLHPCAVYSEASRRAAAISEAWGKCACSFEPRLKPLRV